MISAAVIADLPDTPEGLKISTVLEDFYKADNLMPLLISSAALGTLSAANHPPKTHPPTPPAAPMTAPVIPKIPPD